MFYLKSILLLIVANVALPIMAEAQGNLLIFPKRVIFSNNNRSEVITLVNSSSRDTATYNVSFIQMRLNEDGTFTNITQPDPGQNFADKNLRVYPRTITLAPNESQSIKLQTFQTDALQPGEYRSHLLFRAIPKNLLAAASNTDNVGDSSVSVTLRPVYGLSIPAIIRKGLDSTSLQLDNLTAGMLNDTTAYAQCTLNRLGNMSVYGDLVVSYTNPLGISTEVGTIRGIAVYTPNKTRIVRIPLDRTKKYDFKEGKFNISFIEQTSGKPVTLATAAWQDKAAPQFTSR